MYITDYCCHTSRWVELLLTHTHTHTQQVQPANISNQACCVAAKYVYSHSRPGLLCSGQNCMLTFLINVAVFWPKRYAHIPDQECWLPANSVYKLSHSILGTRVDAKKFMEKEYNLAETCCANILLEEQLLLLPALSIIFSTQHSSCSDGFRRRSSPLLWTLMLDHCSEQ